MNNRTACFVQIAILAIWFLLIHAYILKLNIPFSVGLVLGELMVAVFWVKK